MARHILPSVLIPVLLAAAMSSTLAADPVKVRVASVSVPPSMHTLYMQVAYEEGIYRYRFQGTIFVDREGFLTSSDLGASLHWAFPQNYGDVHVGVYNGEGYTSSEKNDQKHRQPASVASLATRAVTTASIRCAERNAGGVGDPEPAPSHGAATLPQSSSKDQWFVPLK